MTRLIQAKSQPSKFLVFGGKGGLSSVSSDVLYGQLKNPQKRSNWLDSVLSDCYFCCLCRFCMQFQTQGRNHFKNGIKPRTPFPRKCLTQTFPRQTSIPCHLCHPFCPCDLPQCLRNKRYITIYLFNAHFQISGHFLWSAKVLGYIIFSIEKWTKTNRFKTIDISSKNKAARKQSSITAMVSWNCHLLIASTTRSQNAVQ